MELLLWRWSTSVQITSDLLIALFFVVLARSVGRTELRSWVSAWVANLAALSVTIVFWLLQPQSKLAFAIISSMYIFAKTLFVVLLVIGAAGFLARRQNPVRAGRAPYLKVAVVVAIFSLIGGFAAGSINVLGVIQATAICLLLGVGAVFLVRNKTPAYGWLATGFVVRAALAAAEALAYATQLAAGDLSRSKTVAIYLASHSSFDTGAEWMIALGCVLTLYRTIQQELTQSNSELRTARDDLQALLDRDQLTGVFNRRALPAMLRESQATGATILFFDLDEFKKINDTHGHLVGDECLKRFARALQESFRAGDHVIRYAGDEFIVVAHDIDPASVAERIEIVRGHLRFMPADGPRIDFSVGLALLPVQGDPEAALRAADEAMYRDKAA
jgi:diguanylate cyclase (GGDEF)-like protein